MTKAIWIRGVPGQTYETIKKRAEAAGQSIFAYLRDHVIAMAAGKTKAEVIAAIEAGLARHGRPALVADIVADVEAGRRRHD